VAAREAAPEGHGNGGGHSPDVSNEHTTTMNKGKEKDETSGASGGGQVVDEESGLIGEGSEVREKTLEQSLAEDESQGDSSRTSADADIAEMERKYIINDYTLFIKCFCVLVIVILLFFLHSFLTEIHLSLPWVAILGALVLLVLSGVENFQEIIEKVETSTLLFFAGLFVMVRCVEELGVTIWIAEMTADLIEMLPEGKIRLAFAIVILIWVCAIVSMLIDNIPFTTTMIPVVVKLADGTLGLPLQPLTWALAFGACLGGNGTLIGASANVVAAGITEQWGCPISFNAFFRMGFPCMLASTITASFYMLVTHVLIEWY